MKKTLFFIIVTFGLVIWAAYYNNPVIVMFGTTLLLAFGMYFVGMYWPVEQEIPTCIGTGKVAWDQAPSICVWDQPINASIGTKFSVVTHINDGVGFYILEEAKIQMRIKTIDGKVEGWVMKIAAVH